MRWSDCCCERKPEFDADVLDLLQPVPNGGNHNPLKFEGALILQNTRNPSKVIQLWSYMKNMGLSKMSKPDKVELLYRCESVGCQRMSE